MRSMNRSARAILGFSLIALLVAVVALPALAADPSGAPSASAAPEASKEPKASKAPKPERGPKVKKEPGVPVTVTGTVATRTDAGETEYTITVDGKTHTLEAGPAWFFKDKHPLKPFVGKRVTIAGEQRAGETELDVETVDGTRLREPGKPPWAGGWKAVGEGHPGWTQEKADRFKAKFGDCFPPGQCKDKPAKSDDPGE